MVPTRISRKLDAFSNQRSESDFQPIQTQVSNDWKFRIVRSLRTVATLAAGGYESETWLVFYRASERLTGKLCASMGGIMAVSHYLDPFIAHVGGTSSAERLIRATSPLMRSGWVSDWGCRRRG